MAEIQTPPDDFEPDEGYSIDDAEALAFAMRVIRDARSRIAEEVATVAAVRLKLREELALCDEHEERVTRADRRRIAFYEAQCLAHLKRRRAEDPKLRSLPTPFGIVSSRDSQPAFTVDEPVLLAWIEANDLREFVQVTRKAKWGELKKTVHVHGDQVLTADGEVVPGVSVNHPDPTFRVETL